MYILTGGAGFIGSCLLSKLNAQGISDILVVDNLGKSEKWRNLRGKMFEDYMHKDDLLERLHGNRLPEKIEGIFHLGACSSTTELNAEYMMANNYSYSRKLAEFAIARNIRMIYASSAATYGDGSLGFSDADESTPKLEPLNVYGYSKQLFDLWALRSGASKNLVGIKFFNVFGPNEYHKGDMMSVVYKATEQIQNTGRVKLFKSYHPDYRDGEQKRDFIYVKDCCDVLWDLFLDKSIQGIFNLGTGQARTWKDLANAVFAALQKKPNIEYMEMSEVLKPRYQYFTEARMEKLHSRGFYKKSTSLEDAVKDYVQNHLLKENPHL